MSIGFVSNKKEKLFQEILSRIGNVEEDDLVHLPDLLQQCENMRTSNNQTIIREMTHLLKKVERYISPESQVESIFDYENIQDFVYDADADTDSLLNSKYDPDADFDEKRSLVVERILSFCKEINQLNYNNIVQQTLLVYYTKYLLDEHRNLTEEKEFLANKLQEIRNDTLRSGGVGEKLISSVPIKPISVDLDRVNKPHIISKDIEKVVKTAVLIDSKPFKETEEITQNAGQVRKRLPDFIPKTNIEEGELVFEEKFNDYDDTKQNVSSGAGVEEESEEIPEEKSETEIPEETEELPEEEIPEETEGLEEKSEEEIPEETEVLPEEKSDTETEDSNDLVDDNGEINSEVAGLQNTSDDSDSETEEIENEIQEENATTQKKIVETEIILPSQVKAKKKPKVVPIKIERVTVPEIFGSKEEFGKRMVQYFQIIFDEKPEWDVKELYERLNFVEPRYFADKKPDDLYFQLNWVNEYIIKYVKELPYLYEKTGNNHYGTTVYGRVMKGVVDKS